MTRWTRARQVLSRPFRLGLWAIGVSASVLLAGFVGAVAERQGWFDFSARPSVAAQLDAIRERAATDNYGLVASKRVDLHGSGGTSFFLVFRSLKLLSLGYGTASDEIRIYDVADHGTLKLMFRFRPAGKHEDRAWVFRLHSISDLDENGRPEAIGAWEELAMAPIWPRPVVIAWSDEKRGYETHAILDASEAGIYHANKPVLRPPMPPGGFADEVVRDVYTKPTVIRNVYGGKPVTAYGVEDFAVARVGFGAIMAAIFITRGGSHAEATADQVLLWNVGLQLPKPQVLPCVDRPGPTIVDVRYPLSEWLRLYLRRSRYRVRFCQ